MNTPMLNIYGWTNLLKSIAGKYDLSVSFVHDTNEVSISGRTVTIPMPDGRWEQADFDNVLYGVDLYGSMWRYGADGFKDYAELPADKPLGWMMREFEQHRCMREAGEEFKGSKDIMSTGVGNRIEQSILPALEGMDPKLQAVVQAGAEASAHWNRGYASNAAPIMQHVLKNDEGKDNISKLDAIDFDAMLNSVSTPKESLVLAKRVFKALWDEDPDEQEKKEREEGKGEGDGEGGAGLEGANPHSAGESQEAAEGEEGQSIVGGESDGNSTPPTRTDGGCRITTTPPAGRTPQFEDPTKIIHIDLKTSSENRGARGHVEPYVPHDHDESNAAFANKIRRHIMVESQSFYTHGHKRGKVGTKHLYKLACDHDMPGEDRIFKRKHDSDVLDTAISIMVDYSGSMWGSKTGLTYVATDLLCNAMQLLGVPVELNMFSTIHDYTTIFTAKHFDERITSDVLMERSERAAEDQSNNNDSAAVLFAYNRLLQRPEKRKLLLVLSDGHPATHNCSNPQEALKKVTTGIEEDPRVELLGVGIESHAVDRYYKQHVVVNKASEMPTALINLVAGKLLNVGGE